MLMDKTELCFPDLHNLTCSRSERVRSTFLTSLLSSMTAVTVLLNLLLIVSISHFRCCVMRSVSLFSCCRQLHTATNYLVFSLAVTDFLMGLLQMPTELLLYQGCWLHGDALCVVNFLFGEFLVSVSIGNMVLISVDRYIAVCEPMFYSTKVTVKRVQLCVCLCWLFSAVHSSWMIRDMFSDDPKYDLCSGECVVVLRLFENAFDTAVTFLGPITVIVLLYSRVFAVAVAQAQAMRSQIAAFSLKRSEAVRPKKSELKAARTLGVVVVVFLFCYSPLCLITVGILNNPTWELSTTLQYWLIYCNSLLNPLIYAFVYPWFRKSMKHIVTLQILQPNSSETNVLKTLT